MRLWPRFWPTLYILYVNQALRITIPSCYSRFRQTHIVPCFLIKCHSIIIMHSLNVPIHHGLEIRSSLGPINLLDSVLVVLTTCSLGSLGVGPT